MARNFNHGSSRKHFIPLRNQTSAQADTPLRWNQSSSCGTRSAVICYQLAHKFHIVASYLENGVNEMILNLPANATDYESAVLPRSTYVQYDAMRLEVS